MIAEPFFFPQVRKLKWLSKLGSWSYFNLEELSILVYIKQNAQEGDHLLEDWHSWIIRYPK